MNFRPDITGTTETDYLNKTCQEVPKKGLTIYAYSMRWKDRWNNGRFDVEFHVSRRIKDYTFVSPGNVISSWNKFVDSASVDQHGNGSYPVRRVTNASVRTSNNHCLRIEVQSAPSGQTIPAWIQFQILTDDFETPATWRRESSSNSGRSIVNPASSNNAGLMAVGAWDLRSASETSPNLMSYSGRGPVFTVNANLETTSAPTRKKAGHYGW